MGTPTATQEYTYRQHGWKDQLVDINGQSFEYNAIGNPTLYCGKAMVWQGRRLKSYNNTAFAYDADGMRLRKSKNGVTINYFYDGSNLVAEQRVAESTYTWLYYLYGIDGIAGFRYNNTTYLFRKNIQGDVTHIYTESGTLVGQYAYDAWGNCATLQDTNGIATLNPFRYRSYYYDTETNLYYLQSRYYDPETCRFVNADDISYLDPETIGGLNLYAYCGNNPVMGVDPEGTAWWEWLVGAVLIAGLAVATIFTGGAAGVILGAAFYGAVTSSIGGLLIGGIIGGITGGWKGALDGAANGFMWGAISGAVIGALTSGINIATGMVKVVGSAQKTGSLFHQFASNVQAGKMSLAIGRYSEIHLNRSKGLNIKGFRPDVTGVTKNGLRIVEVVSSSQTYASQVAKVGRMMSQYSHIINGLTIDALHLITSWFVF